jgi:hypothetical protein
MAMLDVKKEIELLERCASECALISGLATDRRARHTNEELASYYQKMAQELKSYAQSARA